VRVPLGAVLVGGSTPHIQKVRAVGGVLVEGVLAREYSPRPKVEGR